MKNQFHVISTGHQPPGKFTEIASTIHEHVDFIHIREKAWTARDHMQAIELLVESGVPLGKVIINDRVDVAVASKAGGVQLAHHSLEVASVRESFPLLKIGCSVHSIEEAINAEKDGADFIIYGHIYETASKPGLEPRGVKQLEMMSQEVSVPVVAIGGIKPNNTAEILRAGASGIAVMSGVFMAKDPFAAVENFRLKLKGEDHADSL